MFRLFKKTYDLDNNKEIAYQLLTKFYRSFFGDMYNELNIAKYKPIRDAIGLVLRKYDSNEHPLEYTSKLVLYIQAKVALDHIGLTEQQQNIMRQLTQLTKEVNLSYVYTSPLNDVKQFLPTTIL